MGRVGSCVAPRPQQGYSHWGLAAGALWLLTVISRIEAISNLGLCAASAAAGAGASLAGFALAAAVRGARVACWPAAGGGLALVIAALALSWLLECVALRRVAAASRRLQ